MVLRIAVALLVAASTLAAAELRLRPQPADSNAIVCQSGEIEAVCIEGCGSLKREWKSGEAEVAFDLDRTKAWRVLAKSEGCWSPAIELQVGQTTEALQLPLWRAGDLTGRVAVARGEALPGSVTIGFTSTPRPPGSAPYVRVPETSIECPLDERALRCKVPLAALDVKVSAEGFAPIYFWAVGVELGTISLTRGASLSGHVEIPAKSVSAAGSKVELIPTSNTSSTIDLIRETARTRSTTTNDRGFFQLRDVPPGRYTVRAGRAGWSNVSSVVDVEGPAEVVLRAPLVLERLASLQVVVSPPLDPRGRPWKIVLSRSSPRTGEFPTVATGEASPLGEWRHEQLATGPHLVRVQDGDGATFHSEALLVTEDVAPLRVTLSHVQVEGTVTLGEEPIEAALIFVNDNRRVVLQSDEEGAFRGAFPAEGDWDVEVRPNGTATTIRVRSVKIERKDGGGVAVARLEIPAGRIIGRAVDSRGNPVRATLSVTRDRVRETSTTAGEDGRFEIAGLEPGKVRLLAKGPSRLGVAVDHEVRGSEDGELTLVLLPPRKINLRLLSPSGRAVGRAVVKYFSSTGGVQQVLSARDGDVSFPTASGDPPYNVAVFAEGFAVKMLTISPTDDDATIPIVLGREVGTLVVPVAGGTRRWPVVRKNGAWFGAGLLTRPLGDGGLGMVISREGLILEIEPGAYELCADPMDTKRCITKVVRPGSREIVELHEWRNLEK